VRYQCRANLKKASWPAFILCATFASAEEASNDTKPRTIQVALVQFDSVPEKVQRNLDAMHRLARSAVKQGARWVMFHEGCLTDYTARLNEFSEPVPDGPSCRKMIRLAEELDCFISVGMSEHEGVKVYITQVFVGPKGLVYKYRKSWLWHGNDEGYRNEWARYDTGTGPERFHIDGIAATCFICADGDAPRCIERAGLVRPQVVFYPNNRSKLPDSPVLGAYPKAIGAPMLVTTRVGKSWSFECEGG